MDDDSDSVKEVPTDDGVTEQEIQAIYAQKMQEAEEEIKKAKERIAKAKMDKKKAESATAIQKAAC